jgi:hypothetical protein
MFSVQIFQENTFLETKLNFPLTGKCFPLTNFSNSKQVQKSLENNFPEITFQETNIAYNYIASLSFIRKTICF